MSLWKEMTWIPLAEGLADDMGVHVLADVDVALHGVLERSVADAGRDTRRHDIGVSTSHFMMFWTEVSWIPLARDNTCARVETFGADREDVPVWELVDYRLDQHFRARKRLASTVKKFHRLGAHCPSALIFASRSVLPKKGQGPSRETEHECQHCPWRP